MPSTPNTIELLNREINRTAILQLFRVMCVGHLDKPNATAKYKAVLRECGNENDTAVVVPDVYKPIVFEAFDKDLFVMASIKMSCIESVVMLQQPEFFDVEEYAKANGYPQP